ncbi:unnamed protein product [Rangifer tarandus platyrhynchus]|uniref:Uncharacterized protein n=1 Tax=Rangifer tarandus platyrhynchus TaxID=3082113 RepID=A0AC59ZI58_RANTA
MSDPASPGSVRLSCSVPPHSRLSVVSLSSPPSPGGSPSSLKPEGRLCWERPRGHYFSLLWPPLSAPTFGAFRTRNWWWPVKGLGAPPPGPQELGGESDREEEVGGLQRGLGFPLGGT